jgi:hypothetical protein
MIVLNGEQRVWLQTVLDTFMPKYTDIPDMVDGKPCWGRGQIDEWIRVILKCGEYDDVHDTDWLLDLRLFYIQEMRKV